MESLITNLPLSLTKFILLDSAFKTYNKIIESKKDSNTKSLKLGVNTEVSNPKIEKINVGANNFELSYMTKVYESEDLIMELSAQYLVVLNSNIEILEKEKLTGVEDECKNIIEMKVTDEINKILEKSILNLSLPTKLKFAIE